MNELLGEYPEVFPEDLPKQLPPDRAIEHEIKLKDETIDPPFK